MNRLVKQQFGISLIEVLISLIIAAFGLLGLAAMQTRSLSMQIDSETRRVAAGLIDQLRERVAANQEGYVKALTQGYNQTFSPGADVQVPACANVNACDASIEVPQIQVGTWMRDVQRQLPGAAAVIGPTIANSAVSMTVTIGWIEPNATVVATDNACALIAAIADNPKYRCISANFFPG
ncbi:MAG: type IV pilus modification protein PilV [Burkholderiales bacterium]